MLPNISQVPLAPHADGLVFFFRECQTRQIIITVQFVPKAVLLVIKLLVHCGFLPFIIMISKVLAAVVVVASSQG
jgi:hypothetical protein